jgi:hypothetical protein
MHQNGFTILGAGGWGNENLKPILMLLTTLPYQIFENNSQESRFKLYQQD